MTNADRGRSVRDDLRAAITAAMKDRDRASLAVYRSALAAIDNAEAVPIGSTDHAGAVETSRRELTEDDVVAVVRDAAAERITAADVVADTHPDAARRLRHEAGLLQALLDAVP